MRSGDGLVVGSIGFFGAPLPVDDVEETEVGFGLVEDARGHGAVTEALDALLEHTDRAGVRIRASVQPENRASLRVLAKCGFTQLRGSTEDGELVMVRPVPSTRLQSGPISPVPLGEAGPQARLARRPPATSADACPADAAVAQRAAPRRAGCPRRWVARYRGVPAAGDREQAARPSIDCASRATLAS